MRKIFFILLVTFVLVNCKKEASGPNTEPAPAPAPAPAPTSDTLRGFVAQYDQHGIAYTTGLNTTTVSIDGTNLTTVTQADGSYNFYNMSQGNYTLLFNKPGCGLMKLQNVKFNLNTNNKHNVNISDKPNFALSSAYVKDTVITGDNCTEGYFMVKVGLVPFAKSVSCIAIFDSLNTLDITDPSSYKFSRIFYIPENKASHAYMIPYCLGGFPQFASGSTFFVRVYPLAFTAHSYFDFQSGKTVYTGYGAPYPQMLFWIKK